MRLLRWKAKKEEKKKVAIFVDYENILKEAVENGQVIDLVELRRICTEQFGNVIFSFLFAPQHLVSYQMPLHVNDKGFYIVACPSGSNGKNGKEKDRVDTLMSEIGIKHLEHSDIDVVVIVSHDGDFVRLTNYAKDFGKTVVCFAREKISYLLRQAVDIVLPVPIEEKK